MSGNIKFRWFLLAPILLAISVVVNSPVVSWAFYKILPIDYQEDILEDFELFFYLREFLIVQSYKLLEGVFKTILSQ